MADFGRKQKKPPHALKKEYKAQGGETERVKNVCLQGRIADPHTHLLKNGHKKTRPAVPKGILRDTAGLYAICSVSSSAAIS